MKKIAIMLSVVGVLFAFMPLKASAAGFVKNGDSYCNDADISGGKYGTFKKGDVCYKYTDEANGIKEWTYYLTANSGIKTIYLEVQPSSTIEIQSIKENSNAFILANNDKTTTGNRLLLYSTNPSGLSNGSRTLLFTITTKDLGDEGCYLNISPLEVPNCEVINGEYFDKDGNSITKEEYDEVCAGVVPDVPDEKNPETGSVIPYIAVGGGLLAIAGVYFFSRKSNKFYKI